MTNIGRYFAKLPAMFIALPRAIKAKPKKRSDYVAVGNVFVAKIMLVILLILIVVIPFVFYIYLYPLLVRLFFTAKYTLEDPKYDGYSGKVEIYYDKEKNRGYFAGRLQDGEFTGAGKSFYENGSVSYDGFFEQGLFDGRGALYAENSMLLYRGNFFMGIYHGRGTLYNSLNGNLLYDGDFDMGVYHGRGRLYDDANGNLLYDGDFDMGVYQGRGQLYDGFGNILYSGEFANGLYNGQGTLFFPDGSERYSGGFSAGMYHGEGELSDEFGRTAFIGSFSRGKRSGMGTEFTRNGNVLYRGSFADDMYEGSGILFDSDGSVVYEGGFEAGLFSGAGLFAAAGDYTYEGNFRRGAAEGTGRLRHRGLEVYSGDFRAGFAEGEGTLTDRGARFSYTGTFERGRISFERLANMPPSEVYAAFGPSTSEALFGDDFYLYNAEFGVALRFEYAGETNPARLTRMFMKPAAELPRIGVSAGASSGDSAQPVTGGVPRPQRRALELLGLSLPSGISATAEIYGITLMTNWFYNNNNSPGDNAGTPILYVFETTENAAELPVFSETGTGQDNPGNINNPNNPNETGRADDAYYAELGVGAISGPPPSSNQAQTQSGVFLLDSVAAALENNAEVSSMRTREKNMLDRLSGLRTNPGESPDAEIAELLSSVYQLWEQNAAWRYDMTADILKTLINIESEINIKAELTKISEEVSEWLETAETDFRMSRIDASVLSALRAKSEAAARGIEESELRLDAYNKRFEELTGFELPQDFDLGDAWLIGDAENPEIHEAAALRETVRSRLPSGLFSEIARVIAPANRGGELPQALLNSARAELANLHAAVSAYAAADKLTGDYEMLFRRGEINRYIYYDALYERMNARILVRESNKNYASAMVELDKNLGGIINPLFFAESAASPDWIYEGRLSASYAWAENTGGKWRALYFTEQETGIRKTEFKIYEIHPGIAGNIYSAAIYYNGTLLASGEIETETGIVFDPPAFGGNSLFEVSFRDRAGNETGRFYIDGFANAGYFFEYNPPLIQEQEFIIDSE